MRAFHIRGLMPFKNRGAQILQALGDRRRTSGRSRKPNIQCQQHSAMAAHADAADAYHVDR